MLKRFKRNMSIEKIVAATYAPMHQDGSLNTYKIKDYGDYLMRNNIGGVFMNGSTGDFVSLSSQERKEITLAWSKNKNPNLYLIDHVGSPSLKIAKELANYASDKVDAISVLAPFYFKLTSLEKLVQYCKEVAECAPNLPFYYYHIPSLTGANFKMLDFLELASKEIPTLEGIKFTSNNLIDYLHCKNFENGKYEILFGYDELFLSSLPIKANSWVGSTYNHLAPLYIKIKELFEAGKSVEASDLQAKAIKFVEILDSYGGYNGASKGFMKICGIDCGPSRFPHRTLSDHELLKIKKELIENELIDFLSK
tara:strand:+ start:6962 stop:7891 length:930 start_codon:yes stop_codon:yes gene_type:complete